MTRRVSNSLLAYIPIRPDVYGVVRPCNIYINAFLAKSFYTSSISNYWESF